MKTMMPLQAAPETPVTSPAWMADITPETLLVLGITDEELFAGDLEGETDEERAARIAAAGDILDDRLTQIAAHTLDAGWGWSM